MGVEEGGREGGSRRNAVSTVQTLTAALAFQYQNLAGDRVWNPLWRRRRRLKMWKSTCLWSVRVMSE